MLKWKRQVVNSMWAVNVSIYVRILNSVTEHVEMNTIKVGGLP